MASRDPNRRGRLVPAVLLGTASWYVLSYTGPIIQGAEIAPIPAAAALCLTGACFVAAADLWWFLGDILDFVRATTPTGLKGTAGFVRRLRDVRHDLLERDWGPYWGTHRGQPIFADYASNALTLGPAGTGKGIGVVQPTVMAIRESKTVVCFKGENTCVLANALRRRGEIVRVLNLGDLWPELIGPSDEYNPLVIVADNFWRPGGLRDVSDDIYELCLQLYPEPEGQGGKDDNRYFRDGSRSFKGFAIQTCVLIYGYDATLGEVLQMLNDRRSLLQHALWACGRLEQSTSEGTAPSFSEMPIRESPWVERHEPEDVDNYILYYRAIASGIADLLETEESRTADSFITGAQQALARFNITTRAHKKTSRSTFRFAEQKEGDRATTVFIVCDASRINAQKPVLSLIQWCMMQELKRHPIKQWAVYWIADEATNFRLHDLGSLLTWGRGYGLRLHLILQSLSAFRAVYGKEVLETLLSETEVKQFLPGQREPETLSLIEKVLGEQSVIAEGNRGQLAGGAFGLDGFDYREEGRVLMTADEIRRTDKAILIIRKNRPLLTDLPTIAEIEPFRRQIDINPFHSKPFLRPVRLRLRRREPKTGGPFARTQRSLFGRSAS